MEPLDVSDILPDVKDLSMTSEQKSILNENIRDILTSIRSKMNEHIGSGNSIKLSIAYSFLVKGILNRVSQTYVYGFVLKYLNDKGYVTKLHIDSQAKKAMLHVSWELSGDDFEREFSEIIAKSLVIAPKK